MKCQRAEAQQQNMLEIDNNYVLLALLKKYIKYFDVSATFSHSKALKFFCILRKSYLTSKYFIFISK